MEKQLEKIEANEDNSVSVIEYAVDKLIESMVLFREKEIYIGQQITNAVAIASTKQMIIGSCPLCHKGELKIKVTYNNEEVCRLF